jgi:hypothetical protein
MPQSTNLNVSPYYDDFSDEKNYYKVLFKPGVTVQTRELSNLQSILQNQIEKFGSKFFSNGGIVIPGNFAYDGTFNCIEIEDTYKGISVETYFDSFVGKIIKGRTTGVTAKIEYVMSKLDENSTRNTTALYVKYQNSSSEDFNTEIFQDGEELLVQSDVTVGSTLFAADTAVFRVLSPTNRTASSVGSSAKIEDGVYFIRGYFVNISKDTIILDAYTNTPSYRVGLQVIESIVDSDEDPDLTDNAKGFSNYAAPGADRLKIETTLTKKELDNFDDDSFIELFRVENGVVRKLNNNDPYAFITDVLARRTYDESGNYYVQPVKVTALESLNDNLGNGGQYLSNQKTSGGLEPSDDLATLKVSPGKAYVKGYEVPTSTELVDYEKPRTTKNIESSSSNFYAGNILRVNNITNIPKIGITTDSSITLYSTRLSDTNLPTAADAIGLARVYDFEYHNTPYVNESSQSNLYLFDIQTYTNLVSNTSISGISTGSYIQGQYSNASGYLKTYSGQNLTLYQVSGTFIQNEPLIVSGITTTSTINTVIDYSIQDVKSVSDGTFTSDSSLTESILINGPLTITVGGTTATIVRQDGTSFASGLKVNDIVRYSSSGESLPVYAKIDSINANKTSITISQIASVANVCTNTLGSTTQLNNINIIRPQIRNYDDSSLYSSLENSNISEVSFLNSSIFVKKYYTGLTISSNSLTLPNLSNTDFVYATFDEERYCLIDDSGNNIPLDESKVTIDVGGKTGSLTGLSVASASSAKLIVTQIKSNVSSKYKKLQRCSSVTLNRSKYNPVISGSGLTYSSIYGTRVEDQEISLNYPDIFEVHGIFQSSTSSDPQLPSITISGLNTANIILGEVFIGNTSGAVAICVEKVSSSSISFIYKSQNTFNVNEVITFNESEAEATVTIVTPGEDNIISEFIVDNGQRKHFYDIGRLIKKDASKEISKRVKIVFDYFKFEDTDFGDVISVESYPKNLYGNKIPTFDFVRNTDSIDIRPRVNDYSTASTLSPFEYGSRVFNTGSNNSTQILKSNESIVFDYKFYLPRTDKLTLDKDGNFNVVLGEPSETPIAPNISEEVLDVATISASAYVFNVSEDIVIELADHKRYTMSNIRDIEKRVENLEFYTSLSLLEISTQNLLIEDNDGFNRFKCGFFVDNFSSYDVSDDSNVSFNAQILNNTLSAETERTKLSLETNTTTNLRVTGNTLTLDYTEVNYQKQPFASRIVNINPFNIITWSGNLDLNPDKDKWKIKIKKTKDVANSKKRGTTEKIKTTSSIPYMRSRNVEFIGTRLKPISQFDFIFDSKNLSDNSTGSTYAFPKLIEITNVIGVFAVGELVNGYDSNGNTVSFRLCTPNHKSGAYNNPSSTYSINPYQPSTSLSSIYGPQSTVLNVDTESLELPTKSQYFGNITNGMQLYGTSSGASAKVSQIRLISDDNGTLIGAFFIPNPKKTPLKFETGNTTAKVTTTTAALGVPGEFTSTAETNFVSEGKKVVITKIKYYDPLAQTFNVPEEEGVFITSVDIFFATKDETIPVELQIREVSSGIPGGPDKIVGNLKKVLNANQISISTNASVATNFKFDNLTRLEGGREYAVVLISDSDNYNVWVSRMGEVEISTASSPEVQKVIINKQPSLGSLFKSQNGTTWVATPEEDLKFTLNKAQFSPTSGTAFLSNTIVPTKSIENKLPENPIAALTVLAESPYNDGRHIRVYHPNHGMYSENNFVELSGIAPDGLPVKLESEYNVNSNSAIIIPSASTSNFTLFNQTPVESLSPGYIKIGDEIIKYTGASSGQLTGISRGQFGTTPITHEINSLVYKYEFNGVSLVQLNKTFEGIINPTIDHYYVRKIDDGITFMADKFGGGTEVYASQNIQFASLEFDDDFVSNYQSTSVIASVRTVSSTSVDGSEISFADNGYQSIGISSINKFDTPRMVCSRLNELEYLPSAQFNDNKSLTLELNLNTSNSNISPAINLQNTNIFVENYLINQPINLDSYQIDSRVNSNVNDPNSFIYLSKRIDLSDSATSLKVLLSAYRSAYSDIRVLYKIFRDDTPDEDQNWELFPGYLNLDVNNQIINQDNNDGRSDALVPPSLSGQYLEYSFTADNIAQFTSFAIKIIGTTTNQAYSPLIKDLRAIALK